MPQWLEGDAANLKPVGLTLIDGCVDWDLFP